MIFIPEGLLSFKLAEELIYKGYKVAATKSINLCYNILAKNEGKVLRF